MDFDKVINRKGFSSAKWDYLEGGDVIPLTVADMDFITSPAVMEGIRRISEQGIFGYTVENHLLSDSVKRWYKHKHQSHIDKEWVTFCPRILTGINHVLGLLCKNRESVIVFSPWYAHLAHAVINNDLKLIEHPLVLAQQNYEMDFEKLEVQIKNECVKAIILTNPHNPTGRVWKVEELKQLVNLCNTYDCYLISDDIHSDIVYGENSYYPLLHFKDIHQRLILFNSPAKTFNVAGLHTSYCIIPDDKIRHIFKEALLKYMIHQPNNYAVDVIYQAYMHSDSWYKDLLAYLESNLEFLKEYLEQHLPQIKLIPPEGTYLAWLDYKDLSISEARFKEILIASGVQLSLGSGFGESYNGYARLNYACPRSTLKKALNRIIKNHRLQQ